MSVTGVALLVKNEVSSIPIHLGLSMDPLTGNRYGLADGNPVSFVEWDGHAPMLNGYGRAKAAQPSREAPGSINAAEGPVDHDAVKRAFFWDCEGICTSAVYQAERYETSLTFARSGLSMRCHEDCPDLRESFFYKLFVGDVDNCFSGFTSMEFRGSCVLALIGGVADEAAAGGKGIYRAARGVENAEDTISSGWRVFNAGKMRPGTLVPESFDLSIAGQTFSVHKNATKHMAEYATSRGTGSVPLSSLAASVETAIQRGLSEGRNFVQVGPWELGIDTIDNVIYHAVYRPGKS